MSAGPAATVAAAVAPPPPAVAFVCPACRAPVAAVPDAYRCAPCGRTYPVLFGIPDFRLRPDRYLSLEEERAKARRLHEYAQGASFDALVRHYYAITDDVPADLALRYQAYIRSGPRRAEHVLDDLRPRPGHDTLLDLGCGTGGLLVAATGRYRAAIGVDIALRWLVICRKRLEEAGVAATLVCADVEALPLPEASVTHAVADDLIEHVHSVEGTVAAIGRHLEPGGVLWLSAANRWCVGPHASSRVWAIGFLPRRARGWVLRRLKGVDLLRNTHLVSPGGLARLLRRRGFEPVAQRPKPVATAAPAGAAGAGQGAPRLERALIALYGRAVGVGALRGALLRFGPAFEMVWRKATPGPAGAGAVGRGTRCGSD